MVYYSRQVCHETYKDHKNNWVSPEEIETIAGKKYLKGDRSNEIKVGASKSMSKSKNTIDPENIISSYGADAARLFYLIVHLKKMFNGQRKELVHHSSLFKNYGIYI